MTCACDHSHGWCGATGNRTGDPRLKAAVVSALTEIIAFFDRTLVPVPQYTLHLYDHCPFWCVVSAHLSPSIPFSVPDTED